jgi:hypothetical protein
MSRVALILLLPAITAHYIRVTCSAYRLRTLEDGVLRGVLGCRRGRCRKLCNE